MASIPDSPAVRPDAPPPDFPTARDVLPRGFRWGAVRAGIKASGSPDLAAVLVEDNAGQAAACFTANTVVAAPVTVGREHLAATGGKVAALLVNAGNANCATGTPGLDACRETCTAAAEAFGCIFDEVLPSSTGIIGVPFPTDRLLAAIPTLAASLGDTPEHAEAFASAILTTDTRRKIARAVIDVDAETPSEIRLLGVCKGAGMIAPQLGTPVAPHATMLVYLFTDLLADAATLRALLAPAVERSFNNISVDGDTSTNDTVVLLASGASGLGPAPAAALPPAGLAALAGGLSPDPFPASAVPATSLDPNIAEAFRSALDLVCASLARQIVADGEGVTHVVELHITGAATPADAQAVARTVAHSPLCKTAWSSADPNWGRLLAAAGRSGVPVDPTTTTVTLGNVEVFRNGLRTPGYSEADAHAAMLAPEYIITLDLGQGTAETRFLTCDLTAEYVRINADYST